jgi:hypothetical protein
MWRYKSTTSTWHGNEKDGRYVKVKAVMEANVDGEWVKYTDFANSVAEVCAAKCDNCGVLKNEQDTIADLGEKLAAAQITSADLKSNLDDADACNEELGTQRAKLDACVRSLNTTVKQHEATMGDLHNTCRVRWERIEELKRQVATLRGRVATLRGRVKELEGRKAGPKWTPKKVAELVRERLGESSFTLAFPTYVSAQLGETIYHIYINKGGGSFTAKRVDHASRIFDPAMQHILAEAAKESSDG